MKQYLLAVHHAEDEGSVPSGDAMEQIVKDVDAFNHDLQSAGAWVFAGGLHPSSTATVVRVDDTKIITTDGPYAETKEQLGGFWIIKAPDLDAAIAIAAKATVACQLAVEVRPFQEDVE
ncbi:MAG: YciI family protein [Acidimicrobiales bacterium]